MSKKILYLALGLVLMGSCKKEGTANEPDPIKNDDPAVEVIPDNFVKRAVIEKFTGEWCGYCPGGAAQVKGYLDANGDKLIAVDLHGGDPFETAHTGYMDNSTRFNITGYPSAVIDRTKATSYSSNTWGSKVTQAVNKTTDVGIKLVTSVSNNKLNVEAHIVSNSVHPDAYITILLVENNVPETYNGAQSNYSGPTGNYVHQHLLRAKFNTLAHGDKINLTEARKEYVLNWDNKDISSYKLDDLSIVAIVHDFSYTNNNLTQAYNARKVKVGQSTDWN